MEETIVESNIETLIILLIAIYGAVVSTLVLIWDIYKWKNKGPKIIGRIMSDMIGLNSPEYKDKKLTLVNVTNTGDNPTTITHLSLKFYKSKIKKLFKKSTQTMLIGTPSISYPIPHVLKPGLEWQGIIIQNDDFEKMSKQGILVCSVHFSHTNKTTNFIVRRIKTEIKEKN